MTIYYFEEIKGGKESLGKFNSLQIVWVQYRRMKKKNCGKIFQRLLEMFYQKCSKYLSGTTGSTKGVKYSLI